MRQLIVEIITDEETDSHRAHVYDTYMTIVILASLLPLCFKEMTDFFKYLEWVTTTVFIIDYLLRWSCADLILKNKRFAFVRYPFSPMALIDLVSIVPTFLPVSQVLRLSRIIRLLRIMRALKLLHHSRPLQLVVRVLYREREPLIAVLFMALGYVFVSALLIFNVEPDTFDSFFEALYWAVISLSTIGYGDIYATSVAGQVISMISALMGIAVVALPSGIITAGFVEELRSTSEQKPAKKKRGRSKVATSDTGDPQE
jgi:voltage-gated potassium channel